MQKKHNLIHVKATEQHNITGYISEQDITSSAPPIAVGRTRSSKYVTIWTQINQNNSLLLFLA
jgi:hypothetical protein